VSLAQWAAPALLAANAVVLISYRADAKEPTIIVKEVRLATPPTKNAARAIFHGINVLL